jgi:hypothetical protein
MHIAISLSDTPHLVSEYDVSDFVPSSYRLRFRLDEDAAPERLHDFLGGSGYSSRAFALTTDRGVTFHGCRITTETGREIGVDFKTQSSG